MNLFTSIIGIILFMYVAFSTTSVQTDKMSQKKSNLLAFSIRFLQVIFIIFIILLMYQIYTYLTKDQMSLLESGFIDVSYSSMIEGYEIILVTFSIIIVSINFYILELVHSIAQQFNGEFKFTNNTLRTMKMISNLFVIRILVHILMNTIVFGIFTISMEYIFIYALLVSLIQIFLKAISLQEDSDLAI